MRSGIDLLNRGLASIETPPVGSLGEGGFIFDAVDLRTLIGNVGVVDGWAWLTVSDVETDAFAQTCGSAETGLALEVSVGDRVRLVAPSGTASVPRINIGRHQWLYQVAAAELLSADDAASAMDNWLRTHRVRAGYELRAVVSRGRWPGP